MIRSSFKLVSSTPQNHTETDESEAERLLSLDDTPFPEFQSLPSNVISRKRMITWLLVSIAEPIYNFQAFPYLPQFIQETEALGGNPANVGYIMGLSETTYYAAGGLFVLPWARLSDRIGRKPVLLFSLAGIALSATCLGLSTTFQTIVLSRAILGGLNASDTVLRSSMGDVLVESDFARTIVWLPGMWCIAVISGPLIGGSLAHPYETFPNTFGRSEIWKNFPYLLPNIVIFVILFIIIIVTKIHFQETLPALGTYNPPVEAYDLQEVEYGTPRSNTKSAKSTSSIQLLLRNTRLLLLLLTNMIGTFLDSSFGTILPVVLATPVETGGFALSSSEMGIALALLGTVSGSLIVLVFPRLHTRLGSKHLLRLGLCGYIGSFSVLAITQSLGRTASEPAIAKWLVLSILCIPCSMTLMVPNCFTLLLAKGVRADSLGAVNGLAQTTGSITRAMGPFVGGSLLTLSVEKRLLGGNLVYYVLSGITLIGLFITYFIPSALPEITNEPDLT